MSSRAKHTPLSLRVKRSNPAGYAHTRMRATLLFTGSPRSLRALARIKSTIPSSPLWRGAAQRRGGQRMQESATPLSLRVKRSNPVNNARTRMRATLLWLDRHGRYAPSR